MMEQGTVKSRNFFSGDSLLPDSTWHLSSGVERFKYDSAGRVIRMRTEALPSVVDTLVYESTYGNVHVRRRLIGGTVYSRDSVVYDSAGRPATIFNALNQSTTIYYDQLNRDTLVLGPLGARSRRKYEDALRRATFTDPMGQVYMDSVNAVGWVVLRRDPRGNSETYGYDRLGNVVRRTNRNSQNITFEYDSLSRLTRRIAGADTAQFGYGPHNMWVSARNANSSDTLQLAGPFLTQKLTAIRGGQRFTVESFRNPLNQPTAVEVKKTTGSTWIRTASSTYNMQQSVDAISDFAGSTSTLTYSSFVWLSLLSVPGHSETFQRDSAGRFGGVDFNNPSGLDAHFARTQSYDVVDRVTSEDRPGHTRSFVYDSLGRLIRYADMDSIIFRADTFAYDSVGNRRDSDSQLQVGNRLTRLDQYNIFYDSTGNIVMRAFRHTDTVRYTWDVLGQLTRVIRWRASYGIDTSSFLYDAWGRRVKKTVSGVANSVVHFLHDGDNVVAELDVSYDPVHLYTYLPGADHPHSVRVGVNTYYYTRDGQGNVSGLVTSGNAVRAWYEYSPYGEMLADTGWVWQRYRFKGREWDPETGLYYMRARYYDPYLGRFISEDPIGLAGGLNPYAFVMSDPVNGSDPTGLGFWGKEDGCYYDRDPITGIWTWLSWGDQRCIGPQGRGGLNPRLDPFYNPPRRERGGTGGSGTGGTSIGTSQNPHATVGMTCKSFATLPGIRQIGDALWNASNSRANRPLNEYQAWVVLTPVFGMLVATSSPVTRTPAPTGGTVDPATHPMGNSWSGTYIYGHSHPFRNRVQGLSPFDAAAAHAQDIWIFAVTQDSMHIKFGIGPSQSCAR